MDEPEVKHPAAIAPVPICTEPEVHAIRAMIEGKATPEQQKMGMEWIMREAVGMMQISFRPGLQDMTMFNEGRRYVGVLIRYMLEHQTLLAARARDRKLTAKAKAQAK